MHSAALSINCPATVTALTGLWNSPPYSRPLTSFNYVKITKTKWPNTSIKPDCAFFSLLKNQQKLNVCESMILKVSSDLHFFRTWHSILIVGLISAPVHTRRTHNSADFLLLHELTEKGSVASTHCIPVMTFILNILQWNLLFKHAGPSCSVPSVT